MGKAVLLLIFLPFADLLAAAEVPRENGIELVNPFPATGPADVVGSTPANKVLRAMQDHAVPPVTDVLAQQLRHALSVVMDAPVSLQRRPRQAGTEGHRYVARARGDGRTLLLAGNGSIVIRPLVTPDAALNPVQDLAPVALVARMPMVLISLGSSGYATVREFIARAIDEPGRFHLGSSGEFTTAHLTGELLKRRSGAALVHVSFNGGPAAARGVAARQVEAAFIPLPSVLPYARSARLRALAVADVERYPGLENVPTLGEAGFTGVESTAWYGIFAPAEMPYRQRAFISAGVAAEFASPRVQRLLMSHGLRGAHLGPHELSALIEDDYRRWSPVIEAVVAQ